MRLSELESQLSSQPQVPQEQPVRRGGVRLSDIESQPIPDVTPPADAVTEDSVVENALDVVGELAAGANKAAMFIPDTAINAISMITGMDIPTLSEMIGKTTGFTPGEGGFMEPGLAREAVSAAGATIPAAMGVAPVTRDVTKAGGMAAELLGFGSAKTPGIASAAGEIPALPPPANIPGAKSATEIIDAARAGGDVGQFVLNPSSSEYATKVLKGGKLVTDPIAKQAITQGLDEGLVGMVKTSTPETRQAYRKMLNITMLGKKNRRYADRYRHWDVAGKAMEDRIKFVKNINRDAGKSVNEESKALAGKFVDYSPAIDDFITNLDEYGVAVIRDSDGRIKPDFTKSVFRSSAKPQKIIRDIIKHLDTDNPVDAREVHIAKKYIDELVNWGKGATGNAGQVENVAKKLRGQLNATLGEAFPSYKAANDTYSETKAVLDEIAKASGTKIELGDSGFDSALGTGLRRLLSNAQSKSLLSKSADDIETLSRKYGADFKDDVRDQVSFADELDKLFGPSAKTSIAGEMEKTGERIADVALGQKTMFGAGAEAIKGGYQYMRGINEENKIKALQSLLNTDY